MIKEQPCPYCDGRSKIWIRGEYWDCPCLKAKTKARAMAKVCLPKGASLYTSKKFRDLDPIHNSFYFHGSEIEIWSLIAGELDAEYDSTKGKFTFEYSETYEAASGYSGDEDSDLAFLLNADLVVFHLTNLTWSEKLNNIVTWLYQKRYAHDKPIWFVAAENSLKKTYAADVIKFLNSLRPIDISKYGRVKATQTITAPTVINSPNLEADDSSSIKTSDPEEAPDVEPDAKVKFNERSDWVKPKPAKKPGTQSSSKSSKANKNRIFSDDEC